VHDTQSFGHAHTHETFIHCDRARFKNWPFKNSFEDFMILL